MGAGLPLSEADLHGLVDDCVPASRRAETMRRLAASPADRKLFESWRDQNELIRNAFRDVDKEPLPVSLDLRSPPRLHCISALDTPPLVVDTPLLLETRPGPGIVGTALATALVVCIGLGFSWLLFQSAHLSHGSGVGLRGSEDAILADQAERAVAIGAASMTAAAKPSSALPIDAIPDLTPAGFVFISAKRLAANPGGLVFDYEGPSAERVAITVARAPESVIDGPVRIGNSYGFRTGETLYAVAGTVPAERLKDLAETLKSRFSGR